MMNLMIDVREGRNFNEKDQLIQVEIEEAVETPGIILIGTEIGLMGEVLRGAHCYG